LRIEVTRVSRGLSVIAELLVHSLEESVLYSTYIETKHNNMQSDSYRSFLFGPNAK